MTKDLLSDFERGTEKQWLDKISIDLKGKPIESLNWDSEIGEINPVIFQSDDVSLNNFHQNETNSWNIRQHFDTKNKNINQNILLALKGGVNAIEIKNLSSDNINQTLNEVMLDVIQVYIDINTDNPLSVINAFSEYCNSNNLDCESLQGGFLYDPIGNVTSSGNWLKDENTDLGLIQEIYTATERFKNFSILNVNALTYCNGGANIDTQVANALAHGNEYLNIFKDNEDLLKKVIQKTDFTFGIGTSFFLEIAKIRAFRSLWSVLVKQYSTQTIASKVHTINANLYYSNKDMYSNLLRATSSGMSAVIGGCNTLSLLPFNYNAVDNYEFSQRISKNIQLILQEEAYLNQVKNTSEGSYYIESLINKIKTLSWNTFLATEKTGGFIEALKNGSIQNQITKELKKKVSDLAEEKKVMIGVNKFINKDEKYPSSFEHEDPEIKTLCKPIKSIRLASSYE